MALLAGLAAVTLIAGLVVLGVVLVRALRRFVLSFWPH
jgi:hypothetical protein